MRSLRGVEASTFGRAAVMLVRFPQLILGPLAAGLLTYGLVSAIPGSGGSGIIGQVNGSIFGLVAQLIEGMGIAIALIGADAAWRRDRAPIGEAWDEATRRIGDIFFATIGFSFVRFMGELIGGFLGGLGGLVLSDIAVFFFIYTIPAAAIGGIPGGAALQVSLDRAKDNPIPTLIVAALYLLVTTYVAPLLTGLLLPLLVSLNASMVVLTLLATLIAMAVAAICTTYVAIVLAHVYAALSFGRRW